MDWKYDKGLKTEITLLNIHLKIPKKAVTKLTQAYYKVAHSIEHVLEHLD